MVSLIMKYKQLQMELLNSKKSNKNRPLFAKRTCFVVLKKYKFCEY